MEQLNFEKKLMNETMGKDKNDLILLMENTSVIANLNQAKQDQATAKHRAAQAKDEAVVLGAQVEKVVVTMKVRVGENGKMFGSVTSKDVAEALIKQTGLNIDRRKIELKSAVKGLGEYTAVAKLHTDVTATFKVMVVAE